MRKLGMLIFDEVMQALPVTGSASYAAYARTSDALGEVLGRYDQLALHVIADDAAANARDAAIQVSIETSCDGLHFVSKLSSAPTTLNLEQDTVFCLPDDGTWPSYALVRVHVNLACSSTASAHVRVFATARDIGAHDLRSAVPGAAYHWVSPYAPYIRPAPHPAQSIPFCPH